ncbi:hypothetical protein [Terribacillus sp. JSM ZJ617]|uniref:hypothetical protein n=1 Tax=Terribacillus sp. JSM ZJ617 TaxID=3342119 RepID=UPI0035A956D3
MEVQIFELDKVAEGKLDAIVNKVLSREELPDKLNEVKGNHVRGKIIVRMQLEKKGEMRLPQRQSFLSKDLRD